MNCERHAAGLPRLNRTRQTQAGHPPAFLFPIFAIFLLWAMSGSAALAQNNAETAANPAPGNVVAVVPRSWPPQYSVDDSGQPTGFAIDVMNEVAARADLTVTYVIAENFVVAVDVLRRGDADLIPNSGILAERMDVFSFTAPVETFVVSLFVRNDTNDIDDTADLVGRKLAVVEKNIGLFMFGERQDIQVQVYGDIRTALFQLIAGHVDALVFPQPVLLALTREIGVENRIKVVGVPLKEVKRGIRVMKDNVELLTVLNKAVESFVGTPEYQRIYTKWYGSPTPFWTVARVTWAMGTFAFMLLISMTWWRYRSVLKLNQGLRQTMAERKRAEEALQESEGRFRDFAEGASDWFWEMGPDLRFTYHSGRYFEITGFRPGDKLGTTRTHYVNSTDLEVNAENWTAHLANIEAYKPFKNFEYRFIAGDGRVLHVTISGTPVFDPKGRFLGYRGTGTDITERKRAEKALSLTQFCVDQAGDAVFWLGENGAFEYVNEFGLRMLGYSWDELSKMHIWNVDPDIAQANWASTWARIKSRGPHTFEAVHLAKGGSKVPVEVSTFYVNFGDHQIVCSFSRDITERTRADEALRTREAQLRGIMDNAPIEIVLKDMKGRYVLTNPQWQKSYKLTEEEAQGRTLRDLFPEEFAKPLSAHEREVMETGKAIVREDKLPQSDGVHDFITVKFPIRDTTGELVNFGAMSVDITERKRAEEEIHKLNENLERRVEERTVDLRAAQADLLRQERMATLGQLTATVSHELRNPLGVIRTSTFVARDGLKETTPRVQRALERIDRSVIRCDRIIDEMLDFTRISGLEPEPTPIDVWLDGTLKEQALPAKITLRQNFGLAGTMVLFDRDRFRRAIINVFDNACQAMTGEAGPEEAADADNAVLSVTTQRKNGRVEVIFVDRGPGIAADVLPKIFEPLFSTKGFGVGLGLPVVKQIMEQHGGGIEIKSEKGRGTWVCLWLRHGDSSH